MNWFHRSSRAKHAATGGDRIRALLIVTLALVLLKITIVLSTVNSVALKNTKDNLKFIFSSDVAAKEKQPLPSDNTSSQAGQTADNASSSSQPSVNGQWSIELAALLKQRERELNLKQEALRREEDRLNDLKNAVQAKIQALAELEKKISDLISTKKNIEEEKLIKLAKVFEETPPEQAGPLLSKLDVDIAAELLLKMTGRKAGKIWGYVDPGRAVEISKALARINPNIDLTKLDDNKNIER